MAAFLPHASASSKTVSLQSLLDELTDVNAIARWPQPEFTCKEASSYDRSRIAPDKPGWFANNDHSQFEHVEDHAGRHEQVMLDVAGPGALVRFWLTSNDKHAGILRVYLDRAEPPVLIFGSYDLMFSELVASPLLHPHPSYNPIGGWRHPVPAHPVRPPLQSHLGGSPSQKCGAALLPDQLPHVCSRNTGADLHSPRSGGFTGRSRIHQRQAAASFPLRRR